MVALRCGRRGCLVGHVFLLTAGLFLGQGQEVQTGSPDHSTPSGLFGRLRAWAGRGANASGATVSGPSVNGQVVSGMPVNGTVVYGPTPGVVTGSAEDRSLLVRMHDRIGGLFGRGPNRGIAGPGTATGTGSISSSGRRFTTAEPPLLEEYAGTKINPHP